ncbi:hypothetical protein RhiirC2_796538 [Rhizophagus irregularis]|uniref:RNI-like protein n=1 Tax=Rhizophagus irregularis TaxID=588596 RepID=A0A2N1M9H8_9GLOM|nr:hypothetical protein RhiirC2_796538 [Rhizophagus irregularis]
MSSRKYRAYYSEKERVCAIQEIKEKIIALEHDVIKIHKNLKRIGREIYYLYDAMSPFSKSSESSSSEKMIEEIPVEYTDLLFMTHTSVFNIQELLEYILHFLAVDKSLYPTLYVSRLWYRCGAPILWKRIELKTSNAHKIFMKIIHGEQKPIYCLNVTHLEISYYYLSDEKFESIAGLFPNIVYLDFAFSAELGLDAIANSCHKLEYLKISRCKEFSEIAIWNVIYSCLRIQQLHIFKCNIAYTTIEEIGLYLKLKYFNLACVSRRKPAMTEAHCQAQLEWAYEHENLDGKKMEKSPIFR